MLPSIFDSSLLWMVKLFFISPVGVIHFCPFFLLFPFLFLHLYTFFSIWTLFYHLVREGHWSSCGTYSLSHGIRKAAALQSCCAKLGDIFRRWKQIPLIWWKMSILKIQFFIIKMLILLTNILIKLGNVGMFVDCIKLLWSWFIYLQFSYFLFSALRCSSLHFNIIKTYFALRLYFKCSFVITPQSWGLK